MRLEGASHCPHCPVKLHVQCPRSGLCRCTLAAGGTLECLETKTQKLSILNQAQLEHAESALLVYTVPQFPNSS